MPLDDGLLIARNGTIDSYILPQMANRHGLVAGATGTGKTVSLQVLAEAFSRAGVPLAATYRAFRQGRSGPAMRRHGPE